jgi:hypothetical protein
MQDVASLRQQSPYGYAQSRTGFGSIDESKSLLQGQKHLPPSVGGEGGRGKGLLLCHIEL